MLAMGQWSSARESVKAFKKLNEKRRKGESDWTMTHAFYADMGGFLLNGPGIDVPFPIDAKQLLFLVEQGYLECPQIGRKDIGDRNKSDGVARCFAVCQGVWLLLNCILRAAQSLAVTTLELTTVSFVIVFFATSFCWYHKPLDIGTTITLTLTTDISAIREKHCPPDLTEWYTNPLEFLYPSIYILQMFWVYYNRILHRIHCPIFSRLVTTRPYNRIPSDEFRQVDFLAEALAVPVIIIFGCMFMLAWRFHFPSSTERVLWHIASCYTLVYSVIGSGSIKFCSEVILPRYAKKRRGVRDAEAQAPPPRSRQTQQNSLVSRIVNIDPSKDPRLDIPLEALLLISSLCAAYCLCRAYILVEDFIGLRDLPDSAFQTVEWSVYFPHW
ncbi:uncharacterized protein ATNIH1004_003092 [Aspergillus tanneri]|uniref:Uncharacterized protein n=1 Tax=Aspergillus tanneri TaxID=1220188 RepID=A0A5M9MWS3_9EURO|nr:uncharacterized protein ATNIH1004_003092 [Aspergillus tanneri]KAA8650406.1 hypothetical protein ATNIH1004_003092 [Aspergillus tanneri]